MCLPTQRDEVEATEPKNGGSASVSTSAEENDDLNKSNETEASPDNTATAAESSPPSFRKRLVAFYWTYEFLILAVIAILLARAYPPLGAVYLAPQITSSWIAVFVIFLLSGLNLKTEEFKNALKQVGFNAYVQVYSFAVVSAVVFGVSRGLAQAGVVSQDLADGMVICACLPMTINMVIVFTRTAEGDEAAAIFNASFGNLVGAFISPALILGYLGTQGDIELLDVFYKLAMRVLLPIAIGQILRNFIKSVKDLMKKYKSLVGRIQQYCLIFIIYTTFCNTFLDGMGGSIGSIFVVIVFELLLLVVLMVGSWFSLKLLFSDKPRLRVMGLFGCTQKTVAVGVPLIGAMYENNPAVGLYTLPLIIWYTLQLIIGTSLVPRLAAFVKSEEARLNIGDSSDEDASTKGDRAKQDATADPDVEKALPAAKADETDYGVAMPWVQQTLSGSGEQDSGTDAEGGSSTLSISELDAVSLASSGPRSASLESSEGAMTDTDGEEDITMDNLQLDIDASSVVSSERGEFAPAP